MSNLTSTMSNETSISSSNAKNESSSITNNTMLYTQQASSSSFASQSQTQTSHDELPLAKKKRSLPGNPDPAAQVIALSPKSLLATNKFVCEICNKGFQRDQNLQLHRRGHNLPWKLKQRANKDEIIKKVYVCPEQTCVHHDPARALGDLTGIKKHFCRKHCEKKWKCDKCSKKYAVQSDWKAHSKICGTKEYRCDCGTLFSRRDSFITHRAFCDVLSQETARSINPLGNTTFPSSITHQETGTSTSEVSHFSLPQHNFTSHHQTHHQSFPIKREQLDQHASNNTNTMVSMRQELPPWLACPSPSSHPQEQNAGLELLGQQTQLSAFQMQYDQNHHTHHQSGPTLGVGAMMSSFQVTINNHPHMSATALLQRATEMGVTVSNQEQQQQQQFGHSTNNHNNSQILSQGGMVHDNNISNNMLMSSMQTMAAGTFDSSLEEFHHQTMTPPMLQLDGVGSGSGGGNIKATGPSSGGDGMTRDFLGLRTFSHKDFLNMASRLGQMSSSSSHSFDQQQEGQHNNQTPW